MNALLVDDHALFRDALLSWMSERLPELRWQVAGSLAQALECLAAAPPDLTLLDLTLPDSRGLDTLRSVLRRHPGLRVMVLSADAGRDLVLDALDSGACGFVPKRVDGELMASAMRSVLAGGMYVPAIGALDEPPAATATAAAEPEAGLSPRQLDVLRLVEQGLSNKAVMRALDMSESTVKTHLRAIFLRLGVDNRTQAAAAARRLGLS